MNDIQLSREEALRLFTIQAISLLVIGFVWLFFDRSHPLLRSLYFNEYIWLWGILGGVLLTGFSSLIFSIYEELRKALYQADSMFLQNLQWSDAFYLALISGVSEEILFRGILQGTFGIIPASLLFGLLHIPGWNIHYGLWATVAGFFLGYSFQLTGNLMVPILIHIINNALALVLWLRFRDRFLVQK